MSLKWSVFSDWCAIWNEDPSSYGISLVLSFLQELLDKGHTPSTLKVYVASIPVNHALVAGCNTVLEGGHKAESNRFVPLLFRHGTFPQSSGLSEACP